LKFRLTLFKKRACYFPTFAGWTAILLIVILVNSIIILTLNDFLSTTRPVNADIVVVEGFVPDFVLDSAVDFYRRNNCSLIITSGVPVLKGQLLFDYKTYADISMAYIIRTGFDSTKIVSAPAGTVQKDRTYISAMAVREFMARNYPGVKSFNLVTLGSHARRSRLLFRKAFGREFTVGVVSVTDITFDPRRWYLYSEGFRTVLGEWIAYMYARFLFYP